MPPALSVSCHARSGAVAIALGALALPFAAIASSGTQQPSHTLFMGVDLSLQRSGERLEVREVRDSSIIIVEGEKTVEVRSQGRPLELHAKPALKLSDRVLVSVDGLRSERAYTPKSDPRRKLARSMDAAGAQAAVDAGASALSFAADAQAYAVDSNIAGSSSGVMAAESNFSAMNQGAIASNTAATQSADPMKNIEAELAKENFDAVLVEFELSSPEPLKSPFLVTAVDFRRRELPAAKPQTVVTARPLPAVGPEPRKVSFVQGGLPVGYLLDGVRVHLFDGGAEIGTTVSPMRSALSEEEAFEYQVIDYVSEHRDATLPAAPAAGEIGDDLRAHLRARYPGRTLFVRVLPTGRAANVFADKACTKLVEDETLFAMVWNVRFNPALSKGRPVRGVAPLAASPADS